MCKKLTACILLAFVSGAVTAQLKYNHSKVDKLQYGFGCKISASIEAGRPLFRLSANGGIGYELGFAYPSYHLQFQLYNGGIGSMNKRPSFKLTVDLANALTLTLGGKRAYKNMSAESYALRNSPLYYFSDFCPPPLQNPYGFSTSIGSNWILAWGSHRSKCQRTGFINIHVGAFQFAYSNDGTPFAPFLFTKIKFGDGKDRYYTGDGFAAIHLSRKWEVNTYMLSYHKFTGYWKESFDLANSLFLANVDYQDTVQQYYNRSAYTISAGSLDRGVSVSFDFRNRYFKDIQHLIHLNGYWVLHQVPYRYALDGTIQYFRSNSFITPKK